MAYLCNALWMQPFINVVLDLAKFLLAEPSTPHVRKDHTVNNRECHLMSDLKKKYHFESLEESGEMILHEYDLFQTLSQGFAKVSGVQIYQQTG